MSDTEALRQSILQQSDDLGTRKRFGLFSQPISTAVGDNGPYLKKLHPRDPSTKKPITMPRNFYVSPTKSGQGDKQYFGSLNSLAASKIKDEFIQPNRRLAKQQKQHRDKQKNQASFFTGQGQKILSTSSYQYVEDKKPALDPKRNRDADGRVKSKPRNMLSNSIQKVDSILFKHYPHMDDPYDRAAKLQKQRNNRNRSLQGEASFKPNNFSPKPFDSARKTFGQDVELKPRQPKSPKLNIYKHDSAWKSSNPNKHGLYGFFTPFPEYKQSPNPEVKRKPTQQKTKDAFKLNSPGSLAKPSVSISLHRSNILRSIH